LKWTYGTKVGLDSRHAAARPYLLVAGEREAGSSRWPARVAAGSGLSHEVLAQKLAGEIRAAAGCLDQIVGLNASLLQPPTPNALDATKKFPALAVLTPKVIRLVY
jgi:hypothetical protein